MDGQSRDAGSGPCELWAQTTDSVHIFSSPTFPSLSLSPGCHRHPLLASSNSSRRCCRLAFRVPHGPKGSFKSEASSWRASLLCTTVGLFPSTSVCLLPDHALCSQVKRSHAG